jgi:hypothetical protein
MMQYYFNISANNAADPGLLREVQPQALPDSLPVRSPSLRSVRDGLRRTPPREFAEGIIRLIQVLGVSIGFHMLYALGITAGAHRLWAHKSYHASAPLRFFLMLCNSGNHSSMQAPTKEPSTTGPETTACTTSSRTPVSTPMTSHGGSSSRIWDGC